MTHEKPEREPDELDEYQLRYIIAGAPGLVWIGERPAARSWTSKPKKSNEATRRGDPYKTATDTTWKPRLQ